MRSVCIEESQQIGFHIEFKLNLHTKVFTLEMIQQMSNSCNSILLKLLLDNRDAHITLNWLSECLFSVCSCWQFPYVRKQVLRQTQTNIFIRLANAHTYVPFDNCQPHLIYMTVIVAHRRRRRRCVTFYIEYLQLNLFWNSEWRKIFNDRCRTRDINCDFQCLAISFCVALLQCVQTQENPLCHSEWYRILNDV